MSLLAPRHRELVADAERFARERLAPWAAGNPSSLPPELWRAAGDEGLLVASKIADRVGITRSVIVNALRKFESAGVIESRSLGMKGTYIRVLNDRLFDELDKLRAR